MSTGLFSISVPVGAYHKLLSSCFESLARQTAPAQICLLDASGDARVNELAESYSTLFHYRRHGPDAGQSAAIAEGWANSGGDILGWLNADDLLYPNALRDAAVAFASDPAVDVAYGHSAICDDQLRMTGYHWAVSPPGEELRKGCNISQPSCFFRRRAYDAVGGLDRDLHFTMDWDLWLRLDAAGARFALIEQPLSAVFWGAGTKTRSFEAGRRRELHRLIEGYGPAGSKLKTLRGFAVQAALDNLRPAALRMWVRDHAFRNTQRVFGVAPDGRLDRHAQINWFHLDRAPQSSLFLTMTNCDHVEISSSWPVREVIRSRGVIEVKFNAPVAAGEVVALDLSHDGRKTVRFRSCEWSRREAI